jgi:hypothetical protein
VVGVDGFVVVVGGVVVGAGGMSAGRVVGADGVVGVSDATVVLRVDGVLDAFEAILVD